MNVRLRGTNESGKFWCSSLACLNNGETKHRCRVRADLVTLELWAARGRWCPHCRTLSSFPVLLPGAKSHERDSAVTRRKMQAWKTHSAFLNFCGSYTSVDAASQQVRRETKLKALENSRARSVNNLDAALAARLSNSFLEEAEP